MFGTNTDSTGRDDEHETVDAPTSADSAVDDDDEEFPVLSIPEDGIEFGNNSAEVSEQAVVYISGYLASRIFKIHQCHNCRMSLIVVDPGKLSDSLHYIHVYCTLQIHLKLSNIIFGIRAASSPKAISFLLFHHAYITSCFLYNYSFHSTVGFL